MRARGPSAPACGLRPGGASRGRVAPDGRGLGRGAAGEAVRRPRAERGPDAPAAAVATSRSEGGSSLLPLAAGQRAPFPLPPPLPPQHPAVRSSALGRPAGVRGHLGPCPARPAGATMNGLAVPGPGGSGHLRPGRPSVLAPAPAGQAPRLLSGAGEGRLGSVLPLGLLGSFRDPSPGYSS